MERINKQSNLQKGNMKQKTPTPSLISGQKGTYIRPIPNINSFLISNGIVDFESRKAGIYNLKKFRKETTESDIKWLVLTYKIGKTTYKITSVKTEKIPNRALIQEQGTIEIKIGLWNTRIFTLKELPKKVIDSINENINVFNNEWNNAVKLSQDVKKVKEVNSKDKFFNKLDV